MTNAPVVIGAMGGSGTRVVARIVAHAGIFLGNDRNESEDAMPFVGFYDRWINPFVGRARLTRSDEAAMGREFQGAVAIHRAGIPPHAAWGWKEPRSIYLLPFFHERFPGMKFIHVVRDGRDMAFSSNQNQLRKHGMAVLGPDSEPLPQPVRTAMLWRAINLAAADYGEAVLGPRYLRVRFEDLCANPRALVPRICAFVGCTEAADRAAGEVMAPPSIGRWRGIPDAAIVTEVWRRARPALDRFGYDT